MKGTLVRLTAILSLTALIAAGAEQKTVRAVLQAQAARLPAPGFRLLTAKGKALSLADYRGKVVLLDFWATECGGCVAEIPYFMDLHENFSSKGLIVLGVSLDILYEDLKGPAEGWRRVTPFVQKHKVNYSIAMGDDAVSKIYNIQAMPATYLIDKRGRVAATYIGIVNKIDIESNIKTLLQE